MSKEGSQFIIIIDFLSRNMIEPEISIIVPVYNCERYLERCINSLLKQSFSNWEAIFVNDGSSDRSLELLNQYAENDSRIRVISKKNGGPASARNVGLDEVRTEFLIMVDADDAIEPMALEKMMAAVKETACDMVIHGTNMLQSDGFFVSSRWKLNGLKIVYPKLYFRNIHRGPFAKLYRRSIIERYHLRFPEDMHVAEDVVFVTSYWTRTKNVYFIPEPLYTYYYQDNPNSIIHRFCRSELSYEVYKLNAEASWRTYCFLLSYEADQRVISNWAYELYRELWKMSNNSCRYLECASDIKSLRRIIKAHDKSMSAHIPFIKRICMIHRYPMVATYMLRLKYFLNSLRRKL